MHQPSVFTVNVSPCDVNGAFLNDKLVLHIHCKRCPIPTLSYLCILLHLIQVGVLALDLLECAVCAWCMFHCAVVARYVAE